MMTMRLFRKAACSAVITVAFLCSAGVLQAQAKCLPWDSARYIVKQEGLVSADRVQRRLESGSQKVLKLELCRQGGRYVYRAATMKSRGRVSKVIVDATSGRLLGVPRARTRGFKAPIAAGVGKATKKIKKFFRRTY